MIYRFVFLVQIGLVATCLGQGINRTDRFDYLLNKKIVYTRAEDPDDIPGEAVRVNLELSLDDGVTWKRLATGIDSQIGTNEYIASLRITPDMWTDKARIGLKTLWHATGDYPTDPNDIVARHSTAIGDRFTIPGIMILSPTNNTLIQQPVYQKVEWYAVGFDGFIVATSTNNGATWHQNAYVHSTGKTNQYNLPIYNMPSGKAWIIVHGDSEIYDITEVEIK